MGKTINAAAAKIGEVIRNARIDKGYNSRASLVGTRKLRGKITQEGLRKIEAGERVPRLENIRQLGETLGLSEKKIKELERLALSENVARVTRRAGNVDAVVHISGRPVRVEALPPKKKTEEYARKTVNGLIDLGEKLGWFVNDQDRDWFRRHARQVILKNMNPEATSS